MTALSVLNSFYFWIALSLAEFAYVKYKKIENHSLDLIFANFGVYIIIAVFQTDSLRIQALVDMQKYRVFQIEDGALAFALAFFGVDFLYYVRHWVHHNIPIFWAFHSIHHSSEEFNLSLSTRFSVQTMLYDWIFFAPLIFVGFSVRMVTLSYGCLAIWQRVSHIHSFPKIRWVDQIIVTPRTHQIHHLSDIRYGNQNYGGFFIFWDRLFRTHCDEAPADQRKFGTTPSMTSRNPLRITFVPMIQCLRDAVSARSIRPLIAFPPAKPIETREDSLERSVSIF